MCTVVAAFSYYFAIIRLLSFLLFFFNINALENMAKRKESEQIP